VKLRNIVFLTFILCCQSFTSNSIASDSEMVWCLSQESFVRAGSTLTASGWDSVQFGPSGEKFQGNEAAKAKQIFRTLQNSIKVYEFLPSSNEDFSTFDGGPVDYRNKLDWSTSNVYKSKTNYLDALQANKKENEESYTNYSNRIFIHWRNIKPSFEEDNGDLSPVNIEENYINSYSICKLWYEANN
tara:strand:- start:49 stop:609 length:561 start_codon:yes stop_codon:yes gene_type:complete